MVDCEFRDECYFLTNKVVHLPLITRQARKDYCYTDFTRCAIYISAKAHGICHVPPYVWPGDKYELQGRIVENRLGVSRG